MDSKNKTSIICQTCGKTFSNVYTLKAHEKSIHEQIKNFLCPHNCGKSFVTKYKLNRHILGIHNLEKRDFYCEECGSSFKTRDMLVKHSRVHYKGPFSCEPCELTFKYKSGFDHHNKLKHEKVNKVQKEKKDILIIENIKIPRRGPKPKIQKLQEEDDEKIIEEYIIEEENEELSHFITYEEIEPEVVTEKNQTSPDRIDQTINFICDSCGKSFKSRNHMKRHYDRTHTDKTNFKFSCEYCDKKFLLKYDLQRHMIKHNSVRSIECYLCAKRFKSRASLHSHIKVIHDLDRSNLEKKFICNFCNRSYFHRRHLEYHMRKHTDDRRYVCDKCNERFLYSDALKWHGIRCHDDQAPYNCEICSRKFIHQKTLDSHFQEHDENGSLAVSCPICFKKISEKRHLKRHMRIHQDKSFICVHCDESFQENYQLTRHLLTHELKVNMADVAVEN